MPEFTSHAPGTFCWPELATTDQKSAVSFYRSLLGWDVEELPLGPGATYSMFKMRGKNVGAANSLDAQARARGVPPHWGSYVSVASADEAAKHAKALGGTALAEPFDVMDVGRMAVLQDPTGAVFCVWQPKKHAGVDILGEPGSLCWTELTTRDTKAATTFYTSLFGWSAKAGSAGGTEYTELSNQGTPQGGIMATPPQMGNAPPHWTPYFGVTDVDAVAAKAGQIGGRTYVPPTDIPAVGRFAVIADPQGAVFCVFTRAGH
jgi:uncharacterized protein